MTPEEEHEKAVERERQWVLEEMDFSLNEIEALADGEGIGATRDWLDYQRALMAWPKDPDFPNKYSRPFYITSG